jgi:hypothetical protein
VIPKWFLYLQGVAMVIMGVGLLYTRPRPADASFAKRYLNMGTLWALCCLAVGVALLTLAMGYWTWPLPFSPAPAPRRYR